MGKAEEKRSGDDKAVNSSDYISAVRKARIDSGSKRSDDVKQA